MNFLAVLYNKLVYRPWLRCRLHRVGKGFRIGYASEVLFPHFFSIGDNFYTGPHCYFATNEFSPVTIGSDVMLGPHCKIIGGNHDYAYTKGVLSSNMFPRAEYREIVIESGVWIGTNVVVLSGARIGEGAVIGAMSLVNHFVPPYTVAVGVPAKRFFPRFVRDEDLEELLHSVGSQYTVKDIREIQKEHGAGQATANVVT